MPKVSEKSEMVTLDQDELPRYVMVDDPAFDKTTSLVPARKAGIPSEVLERKCETEPLIPARKPGEISDALAMKCKKARMSQVINIKHYKPTSGSKSFFHSKPYASTADALMIPGNLSFDEASELMRSRFELRQSELGLGSLEGMRHVIVVRQDRLFETAPQIEVIDDQSWTSAWELVRMGYGYSLECGVVREDSKGGYGQCVVQ